MEAGRRVENVSKFQRNTLYYTAYGFTVVLFHYVSHFIIVTCERTHCNESGIIFLMYASSILEYSYFTQTYLSFFFFPHCIIEDLENAMLLLDS